MVYTDNSAVHDSMISCHTNNAVAKNLLVATLVVETQTQLTPWYSRVPTGSNSADAPSWLNVTPLRSQVLFNANAIPIDCGLTLQPCLECGEKNRPYNRDPSLEKNPWTSVVSNNPAVIYESKFLRCHKCVR